MLAGSTSTLALTVISIPRRSAARPAGDDRRRCLLRQQGELGNLFVRVADYAPEELDVVVQPTLDRFLVEQHRAVVPVDDEPSSRLDYVQEHIVERRAPRVLVGDHIATLEAHVREILAVVEEDVGHREAP